MSDLLGKVRQVEERYVALEEALADPANLSDRKKIETLARQRKEILPIVEVGRAYRKMLDERHQAETLLSDSDPDIVEAAKAEINALDMAISDSEERITLLLVPKDPLDHKNIVVEIRAGTGGDEAALFVADLFRMYTRYAESRNWRAELLSAHETGIGGLKEVIFSVAGEGAYSRFKFESGVHRVQRVPETEASGRKHTSTATVAVLPEAEEVDIAIDPKDLRIETIRSAGPGGQSVNTTDSAVRITYLPTGEVVSCQDEKSQHKNRAKAMKVLRSRLLDRMRREAEIERAAKRRSQVGSGDRSEKSRTYNFYENRVTDHRIGFSLYRLSEVLDGDLDELVDRLTTEDRVRRLQESEKGSEQVA